MLIKTRVITIIYGNEKVLIFIPNDKKWAFLVPIFKKYILQYRIDYLKKIIIIKNFRIKIDMHFLKRMIFKNEFCYDNTNRFFVVEKCYYDDGNENEKKWKKVKNGFLGRNILGQNKFIFVKY